tara:strand:- start:3756 stop:3989 length:234 start_codon:yes stop_codon:yes gene_type:complete
MKQAPKNQTKEFNVNKLQRLHNEFEKISQQIDGITGDIYIRMDCYLPTTALDRKLEKLEDKQYKIQCKIEKLQGGVR